MLPVLPDRTAHIAPEGVRQAAFGQVREPTHSARLLLPAASLCRILNPLSCDRLCREDLRKASRVPSSRPVPAGWPSTSGPDQTRWLAGVTALVSALRVFPACRGILVEGGGNPLVSLKLMHRVIF